MMNLNSNKSSDFSKDDQKNIFSFEQNLIINLKLNTFLQTLSVVTILLIILGFIAGLLGLSYKGDLDSNRFLFRFIQLFNMNLEANIPAWFSASLMIFISILTFFIAKIQEGDLKKYFSLISIIFLLMSCDEISSVREILNNPVRNAFSLGGIFYWAWLIPAIIILIIAGLYFYNFFSILNPYFRKSFILAGVIYLSGAVLMEMAGGYLYSHNLGDSLYYVLEVVIEEGLELFGLMYFISSLFKYLKSLKNELLINF